METEKRRRCLSGATAGQEGSVDDYFVLAKYLGFAVALKQTLVQSCVGFFFFLRYLIRMNKIVMSYVKIFTIVTVYPKKDFIYLFYFTILYWFCYTLTWSFVTLHAFLIDAF